MGQDKGPDDRGRPGAVEIEIDAIEPDPDQPRRHFDERSLDLLARSLAAHGLVEPIVVRPSATAGRYLLVVGERCWRAAARLGWRTITCIVRQVSEEERLAYRLAEYSGFGTIGASDLLGVIEEMCADGVSKVDIARALGLARSHVYHYLAVGASPAARVALAQGASLRAAYRMARLDEASLPGEAGTDAMAGFGPLAHAAADADDELLDDELASEQIVDAVEQVYADRSRLLDIQKTLLPDAAVDWLDGLVGDFEALRAVFSARELAETVRSVLDLAFAMLERVSADYNDLLLGAIDANAKCVRDLVAEDAGTRRDDVVRRSSLADRLRLSCDLDAWLATWMDEAERFQPELLAPAYASFCFQLYLVASGEVERIDEPYDSDVAAHLGCCVERLWLRASQRPSPMAGD